MSKTNKVKLGPNDVRVSNFIYHDEKDFIKISDINGIISHRISKIIPKGQILVLAMQNASKDEAQMRFLENYAVITFNLLSCVPDQQLFLEVNASTVNCINRHPDIYGIKENIGTEDDAQIVEEEKELHEAIEEAAKATEDEGNDTSED